MLGYREDESETLDYAHLVGLRDVVIALNWDALPIERDPKATPAYAGGPPTFHDMAYREREKARDALPPYVRADPPAVPVKAPGKAAVLHHEDEIRGLSVADVELWAETAPVDAAKLLLEMAVELTGMRAQLNFLKGLLP